MERIVLVRVIENEDQEKMVYFKPSGIVMPYDK